MKKRLFLIHQGHFVDAAMAAFTANALAHMDAVVEVNVIGKIGHSRPPQRTSECQTLPDWFKHLRVGPYL